MSNFHERYKTNPGGYNDLATGRMMRAGRHQERRRINRTDNFSRFRDVSNSPARPAPKKATLDPTARLQKWKLEKALKKQMEQQKKKPVFKVGVVHHHFYSPTMNDRINSKSIPCHTRGARKVKIQPTPPKRITRATQKRLEARIAAVTPAILSVAGPSGSRIKSRKKQDFSTKKSLNCSLVPENYAFNVPSAIKKLPVFGRFAINGDDLVKNNFNKELQSCMENPWPTSNNVANNLESPQRTRNSLLRQAALDEPSSPASENSRLSTDEAPSETNDASKEARDPEISDAVSKIPSASADRRNFASTVDSDTPPDSNTPAPAMFSPYITMSRGKDSARRERRSKMGIRRSPPDEIPTKDTVMRNLNISVEEEERTAQYFKHILQREIDRLREICAKWEKIMDDPELTEDAQYLINQAIGQTNLLVKKKFERFRRLVEDCETGKGEMLVQCRDLQGFWDMMYMEVKDCDCRFQKLQTLREKNWVEDEIIVRTKKPAGRKKVAATKAAINAKSSARSWILARKKKMSEESNEDVILFGSSSDGCQPSTSGTTDTTDGDKVLTRRGVKKSPHTNPPAKRASLKPTPRKTPTSVLKKVQLSETAKNVRSPLAVMKISQMYKTPEVRLDDSISYVNSDQTPGKGILKKSEETSSESACSKSSRKVDFHDDVESHKTRSIEDLENSIDLGRALARIDTYDSDVSDDVFVPTDRTEKNVTVRRRVEKRLDFEDESFSETVDSDDELGAPVGATKKFDIPALAIIEATPTAHLGLDKSLTTLSTRSRRRNSNVNETINEESQPEENAGATKKFDIPALNIIEATPAAHFGLDKSLTTLSTRSGRRNSNVNETINEESQPETNGSIRRVLRTRKVPLNTPNKSSRRSTKSGKKFTLDSSTKENDNPQVEEQKSNASELSKNHGTDSGNEGTIKRRKSTRKSVRFNADDCTGCADAHKPVHPMTPHSRRNRKISLLGDDSRQSVAPLINGDLMSFDSPSTTMVPPRVRRGSEMGRKTPKK